MTGVVCAAKNCKNARRRNKNLHFLSFPKDPARCKRWLKNIQREDLILTKTAEQLHKSSCTGVCQEHFEDQMFMNASEKNKLIPMAVPTLMKVNQPPPTAGSKRPSSQASAAAEAPPSKKRALDKCKNTVKKVHVSTRIRKKADRARSLLQLRTLISRCSTPSLVQFVMSQVRQSSKSLLGCRWKDKKAFSLSLHHSSPKTYKMLRKIFVLPSVPALREIVSRVDIKPGFCKNVLEALKLKTRNLTPNDKLVSLVLDEMAIKKCVSCDKHHDATEGVVHTTERGEALANHALVFMIRGLQAQWQSPIGYFLSNGAMKASVTKKLLLQAIDEIRAIGLNVVVVLTDQGSHRVSMFETELGITVEQPFFMHQESGVFVMYDPPHLVKSVRNDLRNHGFVVAGHDILWDHIQDFYKKDSASPVRLAPRLTQKHINLSRFSAPHVRLATQVLSHSVAAGMTAMVNWNVISDEARFTATFCEQMDQLFNAFNSSSPSSKACMRHGMTENSGHLEFLRTKLAWLKSIKSKELGFRTPACLHGWQTSISALTQLWETLHNTHGVTLLLTNRLNQDCVENLFSVIRSHSAQRDIPDYGEFRSTLRQVMVESVMAPVDNTNCQEDVDEFLANLAGPCPVDSSTPAPTVSS